VSYARLDLTLILFLFTEGDSYPENSLSCRLFKLITLFLVIIEAFTEKLYLEILLFQIPLYQVFNV